jgi:glycosyltransferase involved in cell wall biosynthesis
VIVGGRRREQPNAQWDVLVVGAHEQSLYSMQRHTRLLVEAYRHSGLSVRLVTPASIVYGRIARSKWAAYIDKFLLFPARLIWLARRAKVTHVADHSDAILGLFLGRRSWISSCHDLNAVMAASGNFEGVSIGRMGRAYQALVVRGLSKATGLTCISHATAAELLRVTGRSSLVAPLPLGPAFRGDRVTDNNKRGEFALIVASPSWRKARDRGIECWLRLRKTATLRGLQLRVVGASLDEEERALLASEAALGDVQVVSGLTDEEMVLQYEGCAFLIMMSRAEGLGWPVVEAGACGRVALCSDIPVLRETGGTSALYIGPDPERHSDWEGIAEELLQPQRREAARVNAERFNADAFSSGIRDTWAQVSKSRI